LGKTLQLSFRGKRDLQLILPFIVIFVALVLFSAFSVDLLSSARAFVGGESLWSKGQKAAVIHLMRYASTHNEKDFYAYEVAIAVPLGDRQARLELARTRPDYGKVAAGLLAGGNHPDDIPGMIRLVRYFGRLPAVDRALTIWAGGGDEVATLNQFALRLHDAVRAGHSSAADLAPLLEGIEETDARLTPLEEAFSSSLSEISRWLRNILIPAIGIVAGSLLFPGVAIVLRDARRDWRHSLQLAHQASHDALTGLSNRIEFERRLSIAIAQTHQNGSGHTLMYLDLDQFKVVNDTCGHAGGDELICQVAAVMREQLRQTDTLARLGGDEFGALLENCAVGDGQRVAEKIRDAVSRFQFACRKRTFAIGVSIGVISLDQTVRNVAAALSAADAACYLAKQNGRNCVQVHHPHDAMQLFHGERV
jgi:diguanylate cyclase (GGDEF)-like protein